METRTSTIEWFLGHCADHRKLSHRTLKAYKQDLSHLRSFASPPPADISISSIDGTVIKATLVNGYLYAPWLVKPFPFLDGANVDPNQGASVTILWRGRNPTITRTPRPIQTGAFTNQ